MDWQFFPKDLQKIIFLNFSKLKSILNGQFNLKIFSEEIFNFKKFSEKIFNFKKFSRKFSEKIFNFKKFFGKIFRPLIVISSKKAKNKGWKFLRPRPKIEIHFWSSNMGIFWHQNFFYGKS